MVHVSSLVLSHSKIVSMQQEMGSDGPLNLKSKSEEAVARERAFAFNLCLCLRLTLLIVDATLWPSRALPNKMLQ